MLDLQGNQILNSSGNKVFGITVSPFGAGMGRILVLGLVLTFSVGTGILAMKGVIEFYAKYTPNPLKFKTWRDVFIYSGICIFITLIYYWHWFKQPFFKKNTDTNSKI